MKILKMFIDILLLIVTFLLVNMDITGHLIHEILGIAMVILLLIHIVANWNWVKSVTKNIKKVNKKTKIMYVINALTMIIYCMAILLGIIISHELFKFETSSNYKLVITHIILGRLATITMLLHLGVNLDIIFKKIKSKKIKKVIYIIYTIIAILISYYSIYTLTHSFGWIMAFGMPN